MSPNTSPTPSHSDSTSGPSRGRFACQHPGCLKSFSRSSHLARHARIHLGAKPFACTVQGCGRRFNRRDCWREHLRGVHGIQALDETSVPAAYPSAVAKESSPSASVECSPTMPARHLNSSSSGTADRSRIPATPESDAGHYCQQGDSFLHSAEPVSPSPMAFPQSAGSHTSHPQAPWLSPAATVCNSPSVRRASSPGLHQTYLPPPLVLSSVAQTLLPPPVQRRPPGMPSTEFYLRLSL
ncbi:hypothetical protein BCR44DRAFT_1438837 [Catenaria anguillulae PL171]|uniref:C2H2-type domain-containing protein n=1 Tax=Catenaria anguillulae PL171 TaxID=765915 RepID=A0A1Y2HJ79_9FUNG|nr:hypothetical protein BCR44DRAFT_1438837 [Catenaria anguillulae PL171]